LLNEETPITSKKGRKDIKINIGEQGERAHSDNLGFTIARGKNRKSTQRG